MCLMGWAVAAGGSTWLCGKAGCDMTRSSPTFFSGLFCSFPVSSSVSYSVLLSILFLLFLCDNLRNRAQHRLQGSV